MSDSEQKVSVRDELSRLPSQNTEGVTIEGQPRGRILLVDDELVVRKLVSRHLVAAGYVVRVAEDGLDAIEKLRAGPLELIISDLRMPRMTGFEFLEVVRKRFPQIPVIVISGFAANELPEGLPADAYCPKNEFLSEQLVQTISDLTSKPPSRTAPPPVGNEPVKARWDGDGHSIIRCEDCLREFTVPRIFRMGRDEAWTSCVHCRRFVRFLVAEKSEAC
jgi:CheY-like chemotaxis protein